MNGPQLTTIADTIPGVLFQFYARGSGERELYYVSGRSEELFGISGDPATFFQKFTAGVAPEDRETFLTSIDNAVQAAGKWDYTGKFIRPTGEEMYFHAISEPVRAGDKLIFNGVLLDITAQEQARRALLAGDAQYRSLVETTGTGYVILDNDGRVVTANQEYLRLCGRSTLDEIQGRPVTDWTAPHDLERNARAVEQCIREGQVRGLEIDYLKPDGTIQPVEINASVIPSGPGQIILTLCRDITGRRTAEKALKKEHEFSQLLLDTSPAFFVTIGEDGRTITMNKAMIDALEYSPEEIRGADYLTTFVPEEDRQVLAGVFRDIVCNGKATITENRIISRSGKVYLVEWHGHPMKHEDKMLAVFFSVGIDITARKNAEHALKESEERYRVLFQSSRDALMTLEPPLWRFTSCNPSTVQMFMAGDEAEFTSKEPWELSPERQPDGRESGEKAREMIETAMQNGTRLFEWTHKRLTGEDFPATVLLSRVDLPGHVFLQATVWDMTEQKRAEEAIRASENRYRTILENTGTAIILIEEDTRISLANAEFTRLSGYSREEIEGKKNWTEFIVKEDLERMLAQHRLRRGNHETALTHYEFGFVTKSGEIRTISLTIEVIPGTKRSVASLMDITERKRAENALRESEVKYHSILDNIQDVFYRSDRDGNLIMMSPSGATLLGAASVDELLGQNIAGKIYADPDARIPLLDVMKKNGFVEDFEVDLRRKDGSVVTVSTNSHFYFDSSGELSGVEGIFRDMTERKAAEEQLKESERKMKDIISFLPDATLVIDKNGAVIAWNRAMEEMTGVPADQMIGKGDYEYALPFYHERRPITIDLVLHDDPAVDAKYPVMKQEGRTRIAEILIPHLNEGRGAYLWFVATPLYDASGNLTGAIESIRDITGHKHAEEALHESEAKFRTLFEGAGDAIFITNHTVFVDCNQSTEKIFARSRDQIIGHSPGEFSPERQPDGRLSLEKSEELMAAALSGTPRSFEWVHLHSDGTPFHAEVQINRILLKGEYSLQAIVRDITDRKQTEEQLRLLLREKEILLREIHHRVGNTMQMAVSMMKMEGRRENDTRVRGRILVIQSRLDAIASTFGMLYHSDNMSRVNFRNVVRSIVGSLQSAYETEEHPLQCDIRIDLPELGVDLALPLALITNELVNNSLRHAFPQSQGGKVTITGLEDGTGWVILTLSDNGQGLDEGIKPSESDTDGFTLVNLLLGQVGGTLSYTSSRNGTAFTIRVPRDAELDRSGVNER